MMRATSAFAAPGTRSARRSATSSRNEARIRGFENGARSGLLPGSCMTLAPGARNRPIHRESVWAEGRRASTVDTIRSGSLDRPTMVPKEHQQEDSMTLSRNDRGARAGLTLRAVVAVATVLALALPAHAQSWDEVVAAA